MKSFVIEVVIALCFLLFGILLTEFIDEGTLRDVNLFVAIGLSLLGALLMTAIFRWLKV